jgi:hypothetical protein
MRYFYTVFLIFLSFFLCKSSKEKFDTIFAEILSDRELELHHIKNFDSTFDLRILRNSIFAKHGYIFKSQDLTNIFKKYNWYSPKLNDVDQLLTINDKYNIDIISQWEEEVKIIEFIKVSSSFKISESNRKLTGIWQDNSQTSAGWTDTYTFYSNGKYIQRFNQMDCAKRVALVAGIWKLENDKIIFIESLKKEFVGGTLQEAAGSCASDYELMDAKAKVYEMKPSKQNEYSFTLPYWDETLDNPKFAIKINKIKFWKFDDNPDNY